MPCIVLVSKISTGPILQYIGVFYEINICYLSAQETFMEMPSSVNVVVGTNATFNCSVRAHALAWFVNNEHVIAQHSTLRSISYTLHHNPLNNVLQSTLTVAANEINNMSMVHCEAYIFGDDENPARSDTAFLQIQGMI